MGSLITRCLTCSPCCTRCCDPAGLGGDPSFSGIIIGQEEQGIDQPIKQYSWDKRPKKDPSDYTISSLLPGEQRVKLPGEVNGEQVIIKDCTESRIYVFDHSSQVTIDDCKGCLIVLGPVKGSVFLRDTSDSTLICASSQLRLRDSLNIHLFLGCESDPIIESSSGVVVAPYMLSYKDISSHFASADLNRWKSSRWGEVYDFTPNQDTAALNFRRLDPLREDPTKYFCPPQGQGPLGNLGILFDPLNSYIPLTNFSYKGDQPLLQLKGPLKEITFTGDKDSVEKFYKDNFMMAAGPNKRALSDILVKGDTYTFTYYE